MNTLFSSFSLALPVLLSVLAQAQDRPKGADAARPPHSSQDQRIRHFLEIERIVLPRLPALAPVGEGTGPLVLLSRRADGSLVAFDLGRPVEPDAADPDRVTLLVPTLGEELEEEIEEEVAPGPMPEEKVEQGAQGAQGEQREKSEKSEKVEPNERRGQRADPAKPDPQVPAPEPAGPKPPAPPLSIGLRTVDGEPDHVELRIGDTKVVRGPLADVLPALGPSLAEQGRLFVIAPGPAVRYGHVLAVAAEVKRAGRTLVFGGVSASGRPADLERVRSLPAESEWHAGPHGLKDVEVLLSFGDSEPWSQVAPIVIEFARMRVWRLAYLGIDAEGRRTKLAAPLPIDGGLLR